MPISTCLIDYYQTIDKADHLQSGFRIFDCSFDENNKKYKRIKPEAHLELIEGLFRELWCFP
jgi:hypothetical protein